MEKLWKKNLISAAPYTAGEQPDNKSIIKLNANENPYPPSPQVLQAIKGFDGEALKLYPDSRCCALRDAIGEFYGLKRENVFAGNGSDDVLALAFRAFFNSDKPIFFPDITYSFYPVWCGFMKIPYKTVPVDDNFRIRSRDYSPENGGVVIPNPNAPTSIGENLDFVRRILEENQDCIVIIDEAYADFGEYSCAPLINEYENLLITGTASKSRSLAGMRVGFALGSAELISVLETVKDSYNSYPLDSIAQTAAIAAFKDREYFEKTAAAVKKTRDRTAETLRNMGFSVADSSTNFLFCTHESYAAKDIFEYLKTKDIYIRYFSLPRIDNYLRITVGTDEQMNRLILELEEYITANPR